MTTNLSTDLSANPETGLASPPDTRAEFAWPVRVYWEDTDAGGIVYHANYLRFFERARSEWLVHLQMDQPALAAQGVLFVVKSMFIDYRQPARLMDTLVATVSIHKLARASLELNQQVRRGDEVLVTAQVRVAVLDAHKQRPIALPATLYQTLMTQQAAPQHR